MKKQAGKRFKMIGTVSFAIFLGTSCWFAYAQVGTTRFRGGVSNVTLLGCASGKTGFTPQVNANNPSYIQGLGIIGVVPSLTPALDLVLREDCAELQKVFGVDSQMFFLAEEGAPNAFATKEMTIGSLGQDGTVFLGVNLLLSEFQTNSGYGVPTILAHEYAHILQLKRGMPQGGTSKWRELHADYLAGWYTAHRGRFRPQIPMASLLSVYQKGDYAFNDAGHHGTPADRALAFDAGFSLNTKNNVSSGLVAFDQGVIFIRAMGAPW